MNQESRKSPLKSPKPKETYGDRFIPTRTSSEHQKKLFGDTAAPEDTYQTLLRCELFGNGTQSEPSLFQFKTIATSEQTSPYSLSPLSSSSERLLSSPRKALRKICTSPFKILEAPSIQDDFYLNLVDWSSQNVLAVGLGNSVYLWNAFTGKVSKLCDVGDTDTVTAVGWIQRGTHLAVGTSKGTVELWDIVHGSKVRDMGGHKSRVGALAWNAHVLSSGSRDRCIYNRDVRQPHDYYGKLVGHKQEVCGLKWSYDGLHLASGGNDNKLFIWDASSSLLARLNDHEAAVKAIAWSPHQRGLLASGGGTADRCIRFWNVQNPTTATSVCKLDTGSQVCNLAWSKNVNELVSTHGYSQNQVIVWSYPCMTQLATLTGHAMRVLYLAVSPDGQTIVTGAGDETLRFWNVFPAKNTTLASNGKLSLQSFKNHMR